MVREAPRTGGSPSRRRFLRRLAAGGAVSMAGLAGCDGDGTTPTEESEPTFLLATPQSGQYGLLGESEQRGFELAVEHINAGGGLVEAGAFDALDGNGVNGQRVATTVVDTGADPETTRNNAGSLFSATETVMACGGVATKAVRELGTLANGKGVPYMMGANVDPQFTAGNCSEYVFREQYPADAIVAAFAPVLASEFAESGQYYQIYSATPEGRAVRSSINDYFIQADTENWQPRGSAAIQPGSTSLNDDVRLAAAKRPDAVVLSMFGGDLANALVAAKDAVPEETPIVVPLIDDRIGEVVGGGLANVLGTLPWDAGLDGSAVGAFDAAYSDAYGGTHTGGIAHVTYTQTLQFAAAAARAGSFDGAAVRSELADAEYDVGLGAQTLLSCRNQATRPVPVVQGRERADADGNHFEVHSVAGDAVSGCDGEAADACSL